jgi:hypothetical protein
MFCKIWILRVGILTMGRIWTRCSGRSETRFVTEHSHYRVFKKRCVRSNIWHAVFWGGKPPNLGVRKILAIWLMVMWGCEKWIHVIQWLGHASIRHAPVYVGSSICMERIRWESNSRSASWDSSHFVELGKFHPHIHKSLPFVHILNETKPICCTSYFCMMSSEPQRCPKGELCSVYGLMQFFFANRRATAWVIPDRERFSWNLSFLVF